MTPTTYHALWQSLTPLYEAGEAQAIVRLLLEDAFGLTMADVLCGGIDNMTSAQRANLDGMMRRLQKAEPIQYVLEQTEFCGRTFHVAQGVLIPRPETELLCQWIESNNQRLSGGSLLDIGTGSGCIAVTLALALPHFAVTAWDISDKALNIAHKNAKVLGADITFEHVDALNPPDDQRRWDIIVSNPPYVTLSERDTMHDNVLQYEPDEALFVPNDDPMLFYRAIALYAKKHLREGGSLYFECSQYHVAQTAELLTTLGFQSIETIDDQFGQPRHVRSS
ncbi:MAG: peptide chain release factor N(5)-glutamine methyltransferase [Prevotella sp.]|nr:peptide chain release factor N(5)-glutamine methyltransferase [Prevotella sp.]